jgi:hypothetical protein
MNKLKQNLCKSKILSEQQCIPYSTTLEYAFQLSDVAQSNGTRKAGVYMNLPSGTANNILTSGDNMKIRDNVQLRGYWTSIPISMVYASDIMISDVLSELLTQMGFSDGTIQMSGVSDILADSGYLVSTKTSSDLGWIVNIPKLMRTNENPIDTERPETWPQQSVYSAFSRLFGEHVVGSMCPVSSAGKFFSGSNGVYVCIPMISSQKRYEWRFVNVDELATRRDESEYSHLVMRENDSTPPVLFTSDKIPILIRVLCRDIGVDPLSVYTTRNVSQFEYFLSSGNLGSPRNQHCVIRMGHSNVPAMSIPFITRHGVVKWKFILLQSKNIRKNWCSLYNYVYEEVVRLYKR